MARVHSFTANDTFALEKNARRAKTTPHVTRSSLEEGSLPLRQAGITKPTAFNIYRAENGNVRPEAGVGFGEGWGTAV